MGSPFPLDVKVDVTNESARSPHVSQNPCNDIEVKVRALDIGINAVVCLRGNEPTPPNIAHMPPNTSGRCPTVDAKVRALGLDIRAVVCIEDRIEVFVGLQ
ncbi:hypothetical protein K7432_007262 [Basidiobolus ranarum]|uniref:Uncharacterized protein n=1 Tax=Basidiobolus ranarum TaxID=34480 RepID=A0ABR2W0D0_9FUNG